MFKVGDYIIYKRDLCKVKAIEKRPKTGEDYYSLAPVEDETLSIKVPVSNKRNNLRYPISKKEAEDLIKKIPNIEPVNINDKLLENTYRELMRTNQHEDLIKIIKTAYLRSEERKRQGKKQKIKIKLFYLKQKTIFIMN